ncbi:hypothetical protein G6F56_012741 [Rhizopus delemar]|nr:hypothetical protein G6F56_012741 [Rhizopus delemar]
MSANNTRQNYTYSNLTEEVHGLYNQYDDIRDENRVVREGMTLMQEQIVRLTGVVERQNAVSEDVRNLLNYIQTQHPDVLVSTEQEAVVQTSLTSAPEMRNEYAAT